LPARHESLVMTVRERLAEIDPELLFADGYDDCIIGIGAQWSKEGLVLYDRKKVIDKLMRDGMDYGEAEEFFEFNIQGAWVGEKTPMFVTRVEDIE